MTGSEVWRLEVVLGALSLYPKPLIPKTPKGLKGLACAYSPPSKFRKSLGLGLVGFLGFRAFGYLGFRPLGYLGFWALGYIEFRALGV